MKHFLLDLLVCPTCLPQEVPLLTGVREANDEELLEGDLCCSSCGNIYPVEDGLGILLPEGTRQAEQRYEESETVAAYLWNHYGDLAGKRGIPLFRRWASRLRPSGGFALDAGCACGRLTFEMAAGGGGAVGIDLSPGFVRLARQLARGEDVSAELIEEGRIRSTLRISPPAGWKDAAAEFLVADATALPFRSGSFDRVVSLNLLDKVPRPRTHLRELGRTATSSEAQMLIADPFSWSEETAPQNEWLGGRQEGGISTYGMETLQKVLQEEKEGWGIRDRGALWWRLRNHRNHFELIRSEYLVAQR